MSSKGSPSLDTPSFMDIWSPDPGTGSLSKAEGAVSRKASRGRARLVYWRWRRWGPKSALKTGVLLTRTPVPLSFSQSSTQSQDHASVPLHTRSPLKPVPAPLGARPLLELL